MASRTKPRSAAKPAGAKRSAKRAQPPRRAKTRALALTDAVRREALAAPLFDRPAFGAQMAWLQAMLRWSPASIIVGQQAAFWSGFAGDAVGKGARRPAAGGRSRRIRPPARRRAA